MPHKASKALQHDAKHFYSVYTYFSQSKAQKPKSAQKWKKTIETSRPDIAIAYAKKILKDETYDRVEIKKHAYFYGKKKRSEETFRIYHKQESPIHDLFNSLKEKIANYR